VALLGVSHVGLDSRAPTTIPAIPNCVGLRVHCITLGSAERPAGNGPGSGGRNPHHAAPAAGVRLSAVPRPRPGRGTPRGRGARRGSGTAPSWPTPRRVPPEGREGGTEGRCRSVAVFQPNGETTDDDVQEGRPPENNCNHCDLKNKSHHLMGFK